MTKTYQFEIIQTLRKVVEIDADSLEAARAMLEASDDLGMTDSVDIETEFIPVSEDGSLYCTEEGCEGHQVEDGEFCASHIK